MCGKGFMEKDKVIKSAIKYEGKFSNFQKSDHANLNDDQIL